MKRTWEVIATLKDGEDVYTSVEIEDTNTYSAQAKAACTEVDEDLTSQGRQVSTVRVDWQEMAEQAMADLARARAAIAAVMECGREADSGWQYIDSDDAHDALYRNGFDRFGDDEVNKPRKQGSLL